MNLAAPFTVLALDGLTASPDQLLRSSGVRRVTADEVREHFYWSHACVPLDDWEAAGAAIRVTAPEPDPLATIGWFALPQGLTAQLGQVFAAAAGMRPRQVRALPALAQTLDAVKAHLLARFPATVPVTEFGGAGFNSPGLRTVTVNRRFGQLMGLHYDSWYGTSLRVRLQPRHRIVVNLGPVPRWFLFVPLHLRTLYAALPRIYRNIHWDVDAPIGDVSHAMVALQPPVCALRLDPGQGYIAATEAVLHDATTRWADTPSYNLQLLGEFAWLPGAPAATTQVPGVHHVVA